MEGSEAWGQVLRIYSSGLGSRCLEEGLVLPVPEPQKYVE